MVEETELCPAGKDEKWGKLEKSKYLQELAELQSALSLMEKATDWEHYLQLRFALSQTLQGLEGTSPPVLASLKSHDSGVNEPEKLQQESDGPFSDVDWTRTVGRNFPCFRRLAESYYWVFAGLVLLTLALTFCVAFDKQPNITGPLSFLTLLCVVITQLSVFDIDLCFQIWQTFDFWFLTVEMMVAALVWGKLTFWDARAILGFGCALTMFSSICMDAAPAIMRRRGVGWLLAVLGVFIVTLIGVQFSVYPNLSSESFVWGDQKWSYRSIFVQRGLTLSAFVIRYIVKTALHPERMLLLTLPICRGQPK